MSKARPQQPKAAAEEKRAPGRPRTSPFDPLEQARRRRQRHRERKRKAGMVAIQIWLPQKWHDAVIARGETLQGATQEAFRLLMAEWKKEVRGPGS